MAGRKRLGEILITAGVLDEARLSTALAEQRKWGGRLGRTLVELGFVDEVTMCAALSRQLQLPAVDLHNAVLPARVTDLLPVDLCERYGVMPVAADRERRILRVATSDPTNQDALSDIGFRSGLRVEPLVATPTDIDKAIRRYYYGEKADGHATRPAPPAPVAEPRPPSPPKQEPSLPIRVAADGGGAASLERIEQMLAAEMRATRVLVQLLVEKGIISREEYLARMKNGEKANP